MKKLGVKSFVG